MKSVIVYFSQTGNTEQIATAIRDGLAGVAGDCGLLRIKDANPTRLYDCDLIGLGSPVIHFEEPGNVRRFVADLRGVGGKHCFAFSTHGTHPEYFFPSLIPRLERRGLLIIGTRDWYASCPFGAKPYPTDGHPDDIDIREAKQFGVEMAERSARIRGGETDLVPPPPTDPKMTQQQVEDLLHPAQLGRKEVAYSFRDMATFNGAKCAYPKCRLCMENCPMNGIDLSTDPPTICRPCISCEFCRRICPTGAIAQQPRPAGMRASDTFRKFFLEPPGLDEAEAEGRFRRHVPKEKVGTDPTRGPAHPIWVIGKGLAT